MLVPALGQNSQSLLIRDLEFCFPRIAEALFPVFATAHRGNYVEVDVRPY